MSILKATKISKNIFQTKKREIERWSIKQKLSSLPDEARDWDEVKPGIDMVNSKLDELEGKTAMGLDQERNNSKKMKISSKEKR